MKKFLLAVFMHYIYVLRKQFKRRRKIVDYTDKIDIMSSGTVTINAPFIVEAGSRFSVAIQQCPE